MMIKSLTGDKFNRVKLYDQVKFVYPPKTYVILKEGVKYRFRENITGVDRRWQDTKLIKNDKRLGV